MFGIVIRQAPYTVRGYGYEVLGYGRARIAAEGWRFGEMAVILHKSGRGR